MNLFKGNKLFLFILAFLSPFLLFSQQKIKKLDVIDSICIKIDSDVEVKWYEVNEVKLLQSELCVCSKMTYANKDSSISKIATWNLHTSMVSFNYYYYEGELLLVEYKKQYEYKVKEQVRYYFEKDNLIKAVHVKGRQGKSKDISIVAREILSNSKRYIDFLNHL